MAMAKCKITSIKYAPTKINVDYEDLLELMYIKRHTRKSLANLIGFTEQALGKWLKNNLPMPGAAIVRISMVLGIQKEDRGRFFTNEIKN